MNNKAILNYAGHLSRLMDGDVWVDETFAKKLTGLDDHIVFHRPLPDIHSVAEIISHLLEWRLSVLSILRGGRRTLNMDSPNNWRPNDELAAVGWQSLLSAFNKSQQEIIELLSAQSDDFLANKPNGASHDYQYYVDGLIDHDMYHLGQLGLIIKLLHSR